MCKKSLLMMLLLALLVPWAANAQTSLFSEDFEGGTMPAGWTTDGSGSWSVGVGDYSTSTGAGHGSYNALIKHGTTGDVTKLITPEINLSTVSSAELSFMHVQRSWAGDIDELRVYYRTSSSEAWTMLQEYTNAYGAWTTEEGIALPNPSSTYQIAFEYTDNYGYGLGIDAVSILPPATCPKPTGLNFALTPGDGTVATLSWTSDADAWQICLNGDETNLIPATTNPYTLTGLTPETTYTAKVRANCGSEQSDWSNEVTFKPTNAYQLTVNDGTTTNGYVPIYGYYVDAITKSQFIIPAENLADMAWGTINKMTFYAAADKNWGAAQFEVYMTETSDTTLSALADYGTMTKVKNAGSLSISGNQMVVEFDTPYSYMGGNLMIGFLQTVTGTYSSCSWYGVSATGASMGGYGSSIYQQNFLPKTTFDYIPGEEPSCIKPTGLAVEYTGGTEAIVSWTSDASAWNMRVNGVDVNGVITNPYTLTGLELATTYEVEVQANCGSDLSEWAGPVSFTTDACMPEDQIVVNYALTDSYGDGWNGNAILVVDESCNIVDQLTIESGYSASGTLKVCGSYAGFYWYKGSYPGETSWVFTDAVGDTLFFGAGTAAMQTLDLLYTIDLNPYVAPSEIDVTEVTNHTAIVSWTENGTATAWQIKLVNGEVETIIDADTNPFTLTGLDAETEYTVNVRAVGSEGTSMWPCVYASFTTEIACPAPSGLTATRVTATSATLNWEGFADTYNVSYAPVAHGEVIESIDFEDSSMGGWTTIDADGDGYDWVLGSACGGVYLVEGGSLAGSGHESSADLVVSGSYSNVTGVGALNPDNYLVSPQVALGGSINFWACGQDAGYAAEHFGVAVSTTGNTDASDFTTIWSTTLTAKGGNDRGGNATMIVKGGAKANPGTTRSGNRDQGNWYHFIIDLSDYSGQGYVAIRHFGCTDQFMLDVDDIVIEGPANLQWINLTDVTGNSIDIDGLEAETEYMWKVQANCGAEDGTSLWSNSTFITTDFCQTPFDLEATDVNYNAATLTWAGSQESYNLQYRTAEVTEEYCFYDFNAGYDAAHEAGWNWEGNIIYGLEDPINNIPSTENYFLQMGWSTTNETYIFSPELPEYESGAVVEFYPFYYSVENTFQIGYSTTTNDTLAFSWSEPITAGTSNYDVKFSEELPAGTKYVAFKATAAAQSSCIFIDNFRIYKVTAAAGEWVTVENVTEPYELTGLTPETEYEWQVQGINADCEDLEWSEIASFFNPTPFQTIALVSGFNWVSVNVDITLDDLKAALLEALPDATSITISAKNQNTTYNGSTWRGSLRVLDVKQMYKIKVPGACSIELTGDPLDPAELTITMVAGNTWIGYPLSESMALSDAFAGFAVAGDKITSKNGNATCLGNNRWRGSLTTLVPGQGYIYKTATGGEFTYPTGSSK